MNIIICFKIDLLKFCHGLDSYCDDEYAVLYVKNRFYKVFQVADMGKAA